MNQSVAFLSPTGLTEYPQPRICKMGCGQHLADRNRSGVCSSWKCRNDAHKREVRRSQASCTAREIDTFETMLAARMHRARPFADIVNERLARWWRFGISLDNGHGRV